ncbi:MAG TPA: hypothetical protein VND91_12040 [Candidatus Saccharimonadia bacterium]|nr:hypothetical protein [Candidatus Saccharimonadia bacterium]
MRPWFLAAAAAFATALAFAPGVATAQAAQFVSSIGQVSAAPGQTISVAIAFTGDGVTYENLDYVAYDNNAFTAVALTPTGPAQCSLINVGGTNFIRIFIGLPQGTPITTATCQVQFRVSSNAAARVYPLEFRIDANFQPQAYCRPNSANCVVRDGSITVQGSPAPTAAPVLAFSATPTFVAAGGSVVLAWTASNAGSCTPSGGAGTAWPQAGQLPPSGSLTVSIPAGSFGQKTFALTCQGNGGATTQQATITVGTPPAPPALRPVALANPTIDGQRPTGASTRPSIASNGRAVVYESNARNLVGNDTNGTQDVFLRDLTTNQTLRVSVSATGQQVAQVAGDASVDGGGNRVALTLGTGLAPSGGSAKTVTGGQVHLFNKSELRTRPVSTTPTGAPGNGPSGNPQVSEDGGTIVFRSEATDLTGEADTNGVADVFAFDVATGNKTRLSDAGAPAPAGAGAKAGPGVNVCSRPAGGRVACEVMRGARMDIVAYSLGSKNSAGTTLSVGATGAANGDSNNPVLSSDGRYAFFDSAASNLVPADANGRRDVFRAELSADGRVLGLQRVSLSTVGAEANGDSERPSTCGTGQYVMFESLASNLVAGDDGSRDVFARDLSSSVLVKLSQPPGGGNANGASSFVAFSPDCSALAYATSAENIAAGGASGQDDVVASASPFQSTNVTGAWFDLAQNGHGLFVEHLPDERVVASWYTFAPDGSQTWLIGVGTLMGNSVTMQMLRPQGGRFPPAFVPGSVANVPFGEMTLRFDTCDSGLLTFSFPAPFGAGTMPLRRPELAAGVTCSSTAMEVRGGTRDAKSLEALPTDTAAAPYPKATGPVAGLTGSWANPSQIGHGFQMEVLSGDRLVVAWYVFTPTGEQMWLIGAGPISGQSATVNVVRTTGGRFIPNFNPALITNPVVGTLTVTALTCNTARVDYAFVAPFGSGSLPISRVTSVRGVPCTP